MKDHSELERAIERAARRHRENVLVNEHLDELAKLWRDRKALRSMLPCPHPHEAWFYMRMAFRVDAWLN